MKKRVYFWTAICWFGKSAGVAWTAADMKVLFKHTKNLCKGTLFEDEDDDGNPCVYRVVETRAEGEDRNVSYVKHFDFPDNIPPATPETWYSSTYEEVKLWHDESRARLAQREDLQPPSGMQDTNKTLEIYNEALYPAMTRFGIDELVEDNASPHNNDKIRQSHRDNNVRIVDYEATEAEKEEIKDLIRSQRRATSGHRTVSHK